MGSTRSTSYAASLKAVVAMASSLGLVASSAYGDVVTTPNSPSLNMKLATVDAISAWAGKAYFGGYRKYEFTRDSRKVVVIVGQPTSGLITSEIVVFHRIEDGTYRIMLTRNALVAATEVTEDARGISFSAREYPGMVKEPLLFIPWTGIFTTAMD